MGTFATLRKGQNFLKARCARLGPAHVCGCCRHSGTPCGSAGSTSQLRWLHRARSCFFSKQERQPRCVLASCFIRSRNGGAGHGARDGADAWVAAARFHKRTSQELSPLASIKNVCPLFKTHKTKDFCPPNQKNRLRRRQKAGISYRERAARARILHPRRHHHPRQS